jgi:hypothetical protein
VREGSSSVGWQEASGTVGSCDVAIDGVKLRDVDEEDDEKERYVVVKINNGWPAARTKIRSQQHDSRLA